MGFALVAVAVGACGRGAERTTERVMEDALKEAWASDAHVQASDDGLRIESDGMAVQVAGDAEIGLPERSRTTCRSQGERPWRTR